MTVRHAEMADVPAVVARIARHHAEAGFSCPFNAAWVSMSVQRAIIDPDHCVLLCRHGLLIGVAGTSPWVPQRIASELLVRAERPGICAALLDAFEVWARARGCTMLRVSAIERHEAAARLWARYGFARDETIFAKAL